MDIRLREAQFADLPLMMAWRSNPLVYQGFYQQTEPLKWEEHLNWWLSRNRDWRTLIIEYENRPVGVVTIGQLDYWQPELGIYIGELSLWGKGIGKEAITKAIELVKSYGKFYIRTTILDSNRRSRQLFKSLGFKKVCKAREGESRYEVNLWN